MKNLWSANTPAQFWQCQLNTPETVWEAAIKQAIPLLELSSQPEDTGTLLALVLGEAQFGPCHWQLSRAKRLYYALKPLLPHPFTCLLRKIYRLRPQTELQLRWPIEDRYVRFQWEVMRQVLLAAGEQTLPVHHLWPQGYRCAFVLTHDIETKKGLDFVSAVADLDESFGFRSSFNFVPERYPIDYRLLDDLRARGFEIGIHGLTHDGKLFSSHSEFVKRARRINYYLKEFDAVGFRSPYTHRQPEWMQALNIEYDLSFFDTDPYEPTPGGSMSIWPYFIGKFVELPYTLVQDCTLVKILGQKSPQIWLQKLNFIEQYYGMALINTHPDYLRNKTVWRLYANFLQAAKEKEGFWAALPREVARWWRARADPASKVRCRRE